MYLRQGASSILATKVSISDLQHRTHTGSSLLSESKAVPYMDHLQIPQFSSIASIPPRDSCTLAEQNLWRLPVVLSTTLMKISERWPSLSSGASLQSHHDLVQANCVSRSISFLFFFLFFSFFFKKENRTEKYAPVYKV